MPTEYLSVTETAKLVRAQLKKHFPGVKFSVRSQSYSGGASIDISWTDGPATRLVDPVARQFRGAAFDGMIDLKTSGESWLLPDGSAQLAYDPGTLGNAGSRPGYVSDAPNPDAVLVHFQADYVFCHRRHSHETEQIAEARRMILKECRCEGEPPHEHFGSQWVGDLAVGMVHDRSEGEPMENAFKRIVLRQEVP